MRDRKVMWSARLPGDLIDQIVEIAEGDGVSQADVVEAGMREWIDGRGADGRPVIERTGDRLEDAARVALSAITGYVTRDICEPRGCELDHAIICLKCDAEDAGVVVGLTDDPVKLLAQLVEYATVVAATAGKTFTVVMDE
jgi:hypothetical protein